MIIVMDEILIEIEEEDVLISEIYKIHFEEAGKGVEAILDQIRKTIR